jgi:ATP-dependent DNA helicase RecQ
VRPPRHEPANASAVPDADPELRAYLREWRRETAKQRGVAAFVVMHDASLDDLCRLRPRSLAELRQVYGFGERKTAVYGPEILSALKRFHTGARAVATPEKKPKPRDETIRLLAERHPLEEIAKIRGRQLRGVVEMVADLVERGEAEFQPGWVDSEKQGSIEAACARLGCERLQPLKDALPPEITFEEIRLVVARVRQRRARQ